MLYRVLRDLWVRPGGVLSLEYVDDEGLAVLIERGIVERVKMRSEDTDEEEQDNGD